jgi:hypothetical protein
MRETRGLRDCACERFAGFAAAASECESGCCLYGVRSEEKVTYAFQNGVNPQGFTVTNLSVTWGAVGTDRSLCQKCWRRVVWSCL